MQDTQAQPPDSSFMIGKHEVRVDGDLVWVRMVGEFDLPDIQDFFKLTERLFHEYGYALVLCDSTDGGLVTPAARRYQAERFKTQIFPSHTAIYGANPIARALVTLMTRAAELMTGKKFPSTFHKNEAEARQTLLQMRKVLQSAGPENTGRPQ